MLTFVRVEEIVYDDNTVIGFQQGEDGVAADEPCSSSHQHRPSPRHGSAATTLNAIKH